MQVVRDRVEEFSADSDLTSKASISQYLMTFEMIQEKIYSTFILVFRNSNGSSF